MTLPPDKLFREGLGQYQKKAPSSAWDRIETNLDRKRNLSPWLKIAAGLMLMVATSILLWQQYQSDSQIATSSNDSAVGSEQWAVPHRESSIVRRESAGVSREASEMKRESAGVSRQGLEDENPSAERKQQPVVAKNIANKKFTGSGLQSPVSSHQSENSDKTLTASAAQAETAIETQENDVITEPDRTNITYTAELVNSKFLKKEFPSEATPEKKNTSGLQKVVAVALDLKYEESFVGELREKKNEWLSINTSPKKREFNK